MGRVVRWTGWLFIAAAAVVVILLGVLTFVIRVPAGQEFALDRLLPVVEGTLDGTLEVGGIRSVSLLRGVTLQRVNLRGPDGELFLSADSVRLGYGLLGLFRGNIELRPLELWAPRIRVFQLSEGEPWNVERIFRLAAAAEDEGPGEAGSETEGGDGPGLSLVLRDVEVVDGYVLVEAPASQLFFELDRLQAGLSRVAILVPEAEGERYHLSRLAFVGRMSPGGEAIQVEDARGWVERRVGSVEFLLDRFWLPGTELSGGGEFTFSGPQGPELELDLRGDVVALEDFLWLDPRLPPATGAMRLTASGPLSAGSWRVTDMDLRLAESRLRGQVGLELADGFTLTETDVEALPLDLRHLAPWLESPLPMEGSVQGRLRADGPFTDLRLGGDLAFTPTGAPSLRTGVQVAGTVHLGEAPGARNLELTLNPLPYPILTLLFPDLDLPGTGQVRLMANGRLSAGMRVELAMEHGGGGLPDSRVDVTGRLRGSLDRPILDLRILLSPLALETVGTVLGREELRGAMEGELTLQGGLDALTWEGQFLTPGGTVMASGAVNARDPSDRYELSAWAEGLELHDLVASLPDPSRVTGVVRLGGRGLDLRTSQGNGVIQLGPSRVGALELDTLALHAHLEGGRMTLDTLHAVSNLVRISGGGVLPVDEGSGEGDVTISAVARDLSVFRPLVPSSGAIAADTLSQLEMDILRLEGLDPDTLQGVQALALEGAVEGTVRLRGSLARLRGEGEIHLEGGAYGSNRVQRAVLIVQGDSLMDSRRRLEMTLDADSIQAGPLTFASGNLWVDLAGMAGDGRLHLVRDAQEEYGVQGAFHVDSTRGGGLALEELSLRFDSVTWNLDGPASATWDRQGVSLEGFRLIRPGPQGMHIQAQGVIPLEGPGDFQLDVQGLSLSRITRILQSELDLDGSLDLEMSLKGLASAPIISGRMVTSDFRLAEMGFTRLDGGLDYAEGRLSGNLGGWRGEQNALDVSASLAANLSLQGDPVRFPNEDVDVRIAVDSLPAGGLLAFLEVLEEPQGVLDGEIRLGGRMADLQPSGSLRLRGGAVGLAAAGIRPSGIQADLTFTPDRRVEIEASARSRGTLAVRGSILMEPVADPTFDLTISASGFQALERRDMAGRLGGEMTLQGRFQRPVVGGQVRVEQGVLFLEEFARSVEVVDLSDPRFFDVVDTSLVNVRSQLAASQNPFLQNLRVDVELRVERDTWIRSREMNVEIGGDLLVTYSRADKEVVLVGPLSAFRGNYTQFGRQFQVREGTVEFVGTPGFDPNLSIQAVNRIRRQGGEPLDIIATLDGTLLAPVVSLSSESQPPIAESDLISYLIFGRPSYALASGESSVLQGAAGAGVSLGLGTLASQLGSVVAQQIGVDYFAITQSQAEGQVGVNPGVAGTFADTQIELGQYVWDDVFLAVVLRPLTGLAAGSQNQIPGARVEWRFSDDWTLEAFVEDRFYRQGVSGFGDLGVNLSKILGLSLYRQWAY
ncbi:MAG: translocation/assembly module TamB domain-containing protein [Gemmatimonadota bacterium]